MADPTAWVGHVSGPPGDQVDVAVENGLPCGTALVDADVEPRDRGITLEDELASLAQQRITGEQFFLGQLEVVRNMSMGNHESMTVGDRKPIPPGVGEVVLQEECWIILRAEDAL